MRTGGWRWLAREWLAVCPRARLLCSWGNTASLPVPTYKTADT